jgi:hypothetical protein
VSDVYGPTPFDREKCRCGHLVEHFGSHMMNCPLNPLRAEAIAEENELAALRAERDRLRAALDLATEIIDMGDTIHHINRAPGMWDGDDYIDGEDVDAPDCPHCLRAKRVEAFRSAV